MKIAQKNIMVTPVCEGKRAPAIAVEVNEQEQDAKKAAIAEARQRSALSKYHGWSFLVL